MRIRRVGWLARSRRRGFTMVEMVTVMGIVGLLAGLIMPVIAETRRRTRILSCTSQMKQFKYGLEMWATEHTRYAKTYPNRLTDLWAGKYAADTRVFQCPLDASQGKEGGKPPVCAGQFPETDEGPGLNKPNDSAVTYPEAACDPQAPFSSYMYEFSGAPCDWWESWVENEDGFSPYAPGDVELADLADGTVKESEIIDTNWDGKVTWQETKIYQLQYGDVYLHQFMNWELGYTDQWFPIVRCFWHQKDPDTDRQRDVVNLAVDGNFFNSGAKWELIAIEHIDPDYDPDMADE